MAVIFWVDSNNGKIQVYYNIILLKYSTIWTENEYAIRKIWTDQFENTDYTQSSIEGKFLKREKLLSIATGLAKGECRLSLLQLNPNDEVPESNDATFWTALVFSIGLKTRSFF